MGPEHQPRSHHLQGSSVDTTKGEKLMIIGATYYFSNNPDDCAHVHVTFHDDIPPKEITLERGKQVFEIATGDIDALISALQEIKENYFP
jgi:YHS domain-containing protein